MNQFFKFLFASCLGTILALIAVSFIGFATIAGIASSATNKKKVDVKSNSVLELTFKEPVPDKTNNTESMGFSLKEEDVLGVHDIVKAIKHAKDDPDIKGVYLNASFIIAGKASATLIREALEDFRSSGKFIISYADLYTQNGYYLASVADSVLLNPVGAVDMRGYASMIAFYKGLLDKMDVQMRIFYAGKFKSATEPFRLDKMSDENRLQIREFLQVLYARFVNDIARGRNLSEADVRRLADEYAGRTPQSALQARLIDRIAYEDEAYDLMKAKIGLGQDEKLNRISVRSYFNSTKEETNFSVRDKIAVVYAEGTISDGDKDEPGAVNSGPYVKLLRKIRNDDKIKAVVLRVNSPGGSVLASENIFREVMLCRQAGKPVVVSMGDVAASGGYYIACQADSIFAEPNTLTGSIGVFGIVPILQKTMKENLGITYDTVRTGRYSAFGSPFIDFSPDEAQIIQRRIEGVYEDFLQKVAKGRRMTRDQVDSIAQGRVWAGSRAREIGLVDDLGGLDRALASAAKLAGLDKYRTVDYPHTKNSLQRFIDELNQTDDDSDDAIKTWMVRTDLGDLYPVYKTLRDYRKNQGLQARLPYELIMYGN